MKIIDIISWVPAKEISLEELESIFMNYKNGITVEEYAVLTELPQSVPEYIVECRNELIKDGKKIACLMKEDNVVALIGY